MDDRSQPESLDDILAAVKETPRGRWFLENYESRLRGDDTTKILGAIATLEKQILSMESSGAETGLLRRARAAIAQARKDIMNLPGRPPELSVEGQLFAKLAALSKQHFPQDSGTGHSVERALRLVTDLDEDFSAPAKPGEAKQFFKQDEAVFEPAPAPKPVVVTTRSEPPIDLPPRGAKLVIQRVAPVANRVEPENLVPAPKLDMFFSPQMERQWIEEPKQEELVKPQTGPTEPPQSRIVIIRRKAEDMDDVPLFEPRSNTPASAA
ncbi:MAG: hypothetical protein ABJA10_03775 [Aestuariivirga sp.]